MSCASLHVPSLRVLRFAYKRPGYTNYSFTDATRFALLPVRTGVLPCGKGLTQSGKFSERALLAEIISNKRGRFPRSTQLVIPPGWTAFSNEPDQWTGAPLGVVEGKLEWLVVTNDTSFDFEVHQNARESVLVALSDDIIIYAATRGFRNGCDSADLVSNLVRIALSGRISSANPVEGFGGDALTGI